MLVLKRLLMIVLMYLASSAMILERYDYRALPVQELQPYVYVNPYIDMASRGNVPATPEDNPPAPPKKAPVPTVVAKKTPTLNGRRSSELVTQSNKLEEIEVYAGSVFGKFGLSHELARATIRIESRTGREMLSPTGCEGWWQACPTTARAYGLKDPYDLEESTHFAARLFVDNKGYLTNYKVPTTDLHLYMSYMIGPKHTQTVYRVVNGKSVKARWLNAAYAEMKPNWHKGKGKMTGNPQIDFAKYYQYFRKGFVRAKNPNFQFK